MLGAGFALIGYDPAANAVRWATMGAEWNARHRARVRSAGRRDEPAYSRWRGRRWAHRATPSSSAYLGTDASGHQGRAGGDCRPGRRLAAPGAGRHGSRVSAGRAPDLVDCDGRRRARASNAGLAWIDDAMGRVMYAALDGTGQMVVSPTPTGLAMPEFSCLGFTPGKDDVTIVYYAASASQGRAGWIIAEGNESGGIDSSVALVFSRPMGTCATVTPTTRRLRDRVAGPGGRVARRLHGVRQQADGPGVCSLRPTASAAQTCSPRSSPSRRWARITACFSSSRATPSSGGWIDSRQSALRRAGLPRRPRGTSVPYRRPRRNRRV